MNNSHRPLWLLAELTYACPLQCPYCSNPVDYASHGRELDTDTWLRVLREARALGSVQLGFSGGEPLVRNDLEILLREAASLGFYTNLITSGVGMDNDRIKNFRELGLDHIQISFQAPERELNDYYAGSAVFDHKLSMARAVKENGYPMVLCFVIHRDNIDRVEDIIRLALELKADYLELATTQYQGWALINRDHLLPGKEQVEQAERVAHEYQNRYQDRIKIYFVVADYYENRPKACMNGWGRTALVVSPDGTALPCHSARILPGIEWPNVGNHTMEWIWESSPGFNRFRGDDWMKEPCKSCSEKSIDFGGCRCQAYLLTGDPSNADPVCDKSPFHHVILESTARRESAAEPDQTGPMFFRNPKNSDKLS